MMEMAASISWLANTSSSMIWRGSGNIGSVLWAITSRLPSTFTYLTTVPNLVVKLDDPLTKRWCPVGDNNGQRFFWAIDYYDETCTYRSKDPCDEDVTTNDRVPDARDSFDCQAS
jgi:hypothetical protein